MNSLTQALMILMCFITAGVFQTVWLKSKTFKNFSYPIDFGKSFAGERIFGDNKTFAAFMVMTPAAAISFYCAGLMANHYSYHYVWDMAWPQSAMSWFWIGLLGGLGFHLGELPNSFIKRRLGIKPGENPKGKYLSKVCFIFDHCDSLIGALLMMSILVPIDLHTCLILLILAPIVHWLFNFALFLLKFKVAAR